MQPIDTAFRNTDSISLYVRLASHEIAFFCNLMAGYEGVAIVRTLDPRQGLLELLVSPDFYTTAVTLLHIFSQELDLQLCGASQVVEPVAGVRQERKI